MISMMTMQEYIEELHEMQTFHQGEEFSGGIWGGHHHLQMEPEDCDTVLSTTGYHNYVSLLYSGYTGRAYNMIAVSDPADWFWEDVRDTPALKCAVFVSQEAR
jgi:hypothetical protein